MSHGRIFEVSLNRKDVERGDYYNPFSDEQIVNAIEGCDYVVKQNNNEFLSDLHWLSETYGILIKTEVLKDLDGKEIVIGVIGNKEVKDIRDNLILEKHSRIEKIKDMLKKDERDIDMWNISYEAYKYLGFYFTSNDDFSNEMDFLKYYLLDKIPDEIIILGSYDYHI